MAMTMIPRASGQQPTRNTHRHQAAQLDVLSRGQVRVSVPVPVIMGISVSVSTIVVMAVTVVMGMAVIVAMTVILRFTSEQDRTRLTQDQN